uniref:Syntaxin-binding protein 6 n=1 Tax=Ailuropoda melanoleuca TaxID=9646 RepID=A0A7N5K807_AILME
MSAKSAISKEIFAPLDERMLGAVQVKRRTKKKIPFLATGGQGEYLTYICLSVTNKKPTQASITKVKQFEGSTSFVRRSQWMLEQLRQVNGIDPNRDSAEFDLLFENAFDQWVASTASEKCTFFQILHHTCQRYLPDRKPEFINCQSKIMGGNSILHSAADSVTSAVQKASQALNERGERLGRAEEKTEDMKNSAQQFAETAHKLRLAGLSQGLTPRTDCGSEPQRMLPAFLSCSPFAQTCLLCHQLSVVRGSYCTLTSGAHVGSPGGDLARSG